jgi:hydroxymethylglutaryl-CoA lyase
MSETVIDLISENSGSVTGGASMNPSNRAVIYEVGPRDGLQNEPVALDTEAKIELVNRLSGAGFSHIEVTSFVNPKWIPNLADAEEVFSGIERVDGVVYSALVPNERGLDRALRARVDEVNVFMSASETHNRKNINKSIDETFPVLKPVIDGAKQAGLSVRGYVSTVFGCPYEGAVDVEAVVKVTLKLAELGVDEISLGDTIGVAVPSQVCTVIDRLKRDIPLDRIALHFHDTWGTALANIVTGWNLGVRKFDSSIGGLGGCPYAPGASGNVSTDDLLYMLHRMGIETGVNEEAVAETAMWLESKIGRPLASHAQAVRRAACDGRSKP